MCERGRTDSPSRSKVKRDAWGLWTTRASLFPVAYWAFSKLETVDAVRDNFRAQDGASIQEQHLTSESSRMEVVRIGESV